MPSKPDAQKGEKKKKSKFVTILMIILDVVIIAAAFGAVFYFIFRNNIGGVTDKYYTTIKNIPVLNLALPQANDPLDPKYMTPKEIRNKYIEYKAENEQLKKQLEEAEKKAEELQVFKDDHDKMEQTVQTALQSLKMREVAVTEKEKEIGEQKAKLDEAIANSDTEAFREYFETIDPDNAAQIYEAVVVKEQTDANVKKFAQVYAQMDPASAAAIFEQMGTSKLDMITETLKAMNKDDASGILEAMTTEFAAKVTEKLNALYRGD
jgi:flagellar basal body-associated protein FliL